MSAFPGNVVEVLNQYFAEHFDDYWVVNRAVRAGDPHKTIGIVAENWEPVEGSSELGIREPILHRYQFLIHNLTLSDDEVIGRDYFSNISKLIRVILYRNPELQLSLHELSEELLGQTERFKRSGVTRQRYAPGYLSGTWNFVGITSFWIETEIIGP
jgi:hypothetical protein